MRVSDRDLEYSKSEGRSVVQKCCDKLYPDFPLENDSDNLEATLEFGILLPLSIASQIAFLIQTTCFGS